MHTSIGLTLGISQVCGLLVNAWIKRDSGRQGQELWSGLWEVSGVLFFLCLPAQVTGKQLLSETVSFHPVLSEATMAGTSRPCTWALSRLWLIGLAVMNTPQPWYASRLQGKLSTCSDVWRQSGKVEIYKGRAFTGIPCGFPHILPGNTKLKSFTLCRSVYSVARTPHTHWRKDHGKTRVF